MSDTANSTKATPEVKEPRHHWGTRFVGYVKRKLHQRRAKKQHEKPADRAARRTATATVWMAIFTVVLATVSGLTLLVLRLQLKEMHEGGIDTHALADATSKMKDSAEKSAQASRDFADTAGDINDSMGDAVKKLDAQAKAIQTSARAAESAAKTADQALHISERAYLTFGTPIDDFQNARISIPVYNGGHIPSGFIKIIEHEATVSIANPATGIVSATGIIEKHWRVVSFQSVPIVPNGGVYSIRNPDS